MDDYDDIHTCRPNRGGGGVALYAGLDIGYVPAAPDAFFRWSGQLGPQQLIFYWPVDFLLASRFFILFFYFFLGLPFIFEKCYEGGS